MSRRTRSKDHQGPGCPSKAPEKPQKSRGMETRSRGTRLLQMAPRAFLAAFLAIRVPAPHHELAGGVEQRTSNSRTRSRAQPLRTGSERWRLTEAVRVQFSSLARAQRLRTSSPQLRRSPCWDSASLQSVEGHQEPPKSLRSHVDGELALGNMENAEDDTGFSSRLLADAYSGGLTRLAG